MHRLNVSLLCLLSLSLAGSAIAQTADPQSDSAGVATYDSYSGGATLGSGTYFNVRYMSGNGVGYQQGYGQIGAFVPYWLGEDALIAPDVRLLMGNNSTIGGNLGLVGRKYSPGYDRIFGAAAYLDMDQSSNRNTYTQGVFGLETLGQYWDLRGNAYYVPGNQDHLVSTGAPLCVTGDPFFSGNNIVFMGQQAAIREQGMSGFDVEFGMPLTQAAPWLRVYAGAYYYQADQLAPPPVDVAIPNTTEDTPVGFRARMDAWIADDLLLGVNVTTDPVWGTNVNGMVDFRFSGFKPTRYFPQWTTRDRMLAPWQRNWRVAVQEYGTANNTTISAINPDTGNPYFVSFIDNSNPNPGDGTFENPFNSFNHPNGIAGADIILVDRGTSTEAAPYLGSMRLFDNQLLLGEGSTIDPLRLSAQFGMCSVDGNFALPGLDGSGNYPFVSNPAAAPAITLGNNNEVAGFNIVNGGGDGIFGNGVNNFNLHNIEITGNAGRGINLVNATGTTTIIRDINVGSTNHPNPGGLGNNAGGGIFVSTGAGGINDLQLTNVFMNSNPQGAQQFGVALTAVNGALNTNMNNVHANGNVNGIILTETNQALTATMTGVTANGNSNDGLQLFANSGTATLNLNTSQTNGNGRDGLGRYASGGSLTTVNIINGQMSGNVRSGIHDEASGGSTINLNIDPTIVNQNGQDGYYFKLTEGAVLNFASANDSFSSNVRSAFYGEMDNSTANINLQSTLATNSGANGFLLSATNGSVFNGSMTNVNFSSSGANGMIVAATNGSSATFNMAGVLNNANVQNGVAFLADDSVFSMTAFSSTFNGNFANGIVGTAQNGASANLTVDGGSSISGNTVNGVYVSTTGLSNVLAGFNDTAINNNVTGNGVRLNMVNSPASGLALTGTTALTGNGANGLLVDAYTNTVFTATLTGTTLNGNAQDGVKMNVGSGSAVSGSWTNVATAGNQDNGIDLTVFGAGSIADLSVTNLNAAVNTNSNGLLSVSNGGFLNFAVNGGSFSNSVNGSGLQVAVSGLNSTAYVDLDGVTIDGNAQAGLTASVAAPAPGVGQTGASLNVCLESSSVSNNTLQGIAIVSVGDGATASFGVGTLTPGSESNVNNNGREGVLGNAIDGGTINFRSIGSHFDNNGLAATSDGANFGGDRGVIRTLFYGGSADGNSGNGVRLGPISPNASSFGSDLTLSVGNGFSASNNGGYGLVLDGTGANSANMIQDPNSAPIVLSGNGLGAQDLNFSGANQVLLQLLGSFDNSGGDGVNLVFNNITTAIVSINGLGNGTIDNNAGNGIFVQFNNVTNTAVTVSGYNSISNNGLDGIHIEMNGAAPNNKSKGAIQIQGIAGNTLMDNNGLNGVNILLENTDLVDPFNSLPGVNLNVLTTTDNDPFNACIPVAVVLPAGGGGLIPTTALGIDSLDVSNSGAGGGTGGITVAGTDATVVPNNGFITNNNVSNSQNGSGISVSLNETIAPTTPIASGFTITGNTVTGSQGNGIEFNITNAAVINVATADNLHINNNNVTLNNGNGIQVMLDNPTGSVTTADGMQFNGNVVTDNTGYGLLLDLTTVDVTGMQINSTSLSSNDLGGLDIRLDDSSIATLTASSLTIEDNNLNGLRLLLENASSFTGATFATTSIRNNGQDGVNVQAVDGTASTFGTLADSIQFNGSTILDNGQLAASDGVRLRLYGGSTGNLQFNSTSIGNSVPAATQQYGLDFILGSGAFPGGQLVTSFTDSNISGHNVDGILGVVNGTGVAGESLATISLSNTIVQFNNNAGIATSVDNGGTLGLTVANNSLIGTNGSDGIHVNSTDTDTTVAVSILDSTIANNGQVTPPGIGNGLTLNLDNDATGTLTVTNAVIGNTAPGGTQQNGLMLNVNQTTVGSATNLVASIMTSNLSNNDVSAIAGNITGNNVGLNPVNGLTIMMQQVLADANGGNGVAFNVDNGALLRMGIHDSAITGSGQNGVYLNAEDTFTLVAVDMHDSALNNNGTIVFPGDGFNATVSLGASLNVCAETTIGSVTPMSFSGNTGDGFDVLVSDVGSRADIDLHSVIAGADAVNGLLGNELNGVKADVFDGGELNLRANTTHFDGNLGAGLLASVNNTNGQDTVGRFRIIGGTADNNVGDGYSLLATNTTVGPVGVATLTAQFQADDFGNGISAQNNGGFGLNFVASNLNPPGGGIVGNLLMTGGSTMLGNGAGTVNVDMEGADQAIIGLSGTFNGSSGDGIHIELKDITGLALVSLQGPGEVRNNAGDGIDVLLQNVAQGGVFIGGFTDVSDNGTGNNAVLGQDGIKVTMDNVALGAVTIDAQTTALPANIMNVSNNTGNGVNVIANNGSVIDNTAFNAILGANLVEVIDYQAPEVPCPDPLPNPLLTIVPVNVSTALGITFTDTLTIQNLNLDSNGNATGGNLSGDAIVLTTNTLAQIIGTVGNPGPVITNNTITNTGSTSATSTHDGVVVHVLGGADVVQVDVLNNDIQSNNGNGINLIVNGAPTLTALNVTDNIVSNNFGGIGTSGNGIVVDLDNAAVLANVIVDGNDVSGNTGDGFQMLNPVTGVDLAVGFLHNQFIGNGSIVPANATTTYPAGGMGIDITLNNQNIIRTTVNVLSDANGVNTVSGSASFGLFLQAMNDALYDLNVTGTGGPNVFDSNVDAGIAVVGGSFVNPNNSLNPARFSVGNVLIDNVQVTNTALGSHPALPNYPFSGDGIGILLQQYAQMNSFVIGSSVARNTTLANNAGDGLRINAIEQSQFRHTQPDGITAITPLGQATILLQQIDATDNGRNGINIIRRDNAVLSWDDQTINPGAALFTVFNPLSWQAITDGGSFIHINDIIATGNGTNGVVGANNGLSISTTNAQFPVTRVDIIDTAPVAMTYNPKLVGNSVYDANAGRGMHFVSSADSILVVNARDTSVSDNLSGGVLVQTFNRATFGDVLTATPLGNPTSDNSIRSTFDGMLISGNGASNTNAGAHGFEVQANGGADPNNVSSSSVVNISMTGTATNARNLFDSNGGDAFRITANRFSFNYLNLNRIDMRDTAFVQLGNDGLHINANQNSTTRVDLTNASIGFPTASSTQTGLSGDGIDATSTGSSFLALNVGNTLALNRFGDGIAPGAADPVNAPDVSIYGNQLNGIVVRNQGSSFFVGSVFDTASRFNGNRGYSAEMQDGNESNTYDHRIDHSLFSDNSFEGIAVIANARSRSGYFRDQASIATTNPAFQNGYLLNDYMNLTPALQATFVLTDSRVENNGSASPYVNANNNVNGLEIAVSTRSYVAADIRNNLFGGNTLDDVATSSFQASTGGFNANGTINPTGLQSTPGSIDEIAPGIDRIFLEDTAQLDMRFMHNVGDQIRISSTNSNNPNMNSNGAFRTDPNTKFQPNTNQSTAIFQVNAFHYDTVGPVTSDNVFSGTNIQPLDVASGFFVLDGVNFPGRFLEAAFVDQDDFYTNPNAFPTNPFPTAFTQVRLDNITTGVNGTGANGVIDYVGATGTFTLAGAGSPGVTAGHVIRVHLLDTNTFNQAGTAQNVEGAFSGTFFNGFGPARNIRVPPGQGGTNFPTNPLAPYYVWPSSSFPPN